MAKMFILCVCVCLFGWGSVYLFCDCLDYQTFPRVFDYLELVPPSLSLSLSLSHCPTKVACCLNFTLKNYSSCQMFLVCSGYHLPKVISGMTVGEPATGSLMVTGTKGYPTVSSHRRATVAKMAEKFILILFKRF